VAKLVSRDSAAAIFVEVRERRTQVAFFQVVVAVKAGCDKLCIVYQTVLIGIDHRHCLGEISKVKIDPGNLREPQL